MCCCGCRSPSKPLRNETKRNEVIFRNDLQARYRGTMHAHVPFCINLSTSVFTLAAGITSSLDTLPTYKRGFSNSHGGLMGSDNTGYRPKNSILNDERWPKGQRSMANSAKGSELLNKFKNYSEARTAYEEKTVAFIDHSPFRNFKP